MNVFYGVSYSNKVDAGGNVLLPYRRELEALRVAMQQKQQLVISGQENPVYMIRGMVDSQTFATHAVCPDQPARLLAIQDFLKIAQ